MEYGQTIIPDRRRFRFTLFLPTNGGTDMIATIANNPESFGTIYQVNWAQCIDQNVPRGAKFLVTHRFVNEIGVVTDPNKPSAFIVAQGLPGIQTAFATKYPLPGSVINIASMSTPAWTDTQHCGGFGADATSFVCGHPGSSIGQLSLSFWKCLGNGVNGVPVVEPNGAHQLTFELVSDE